MARGSRDGEIFRSPEKWLVLTEDALSIDKGMAEHLPDKSLSVTILSNPQEGPLLIRKWRGGFGTFIFLPCAEELVLRPITALCDRMRQLATMR
jgi:hypothetical protein